MTSTNVSNNVDSIAEGDAFVPFKSEFAVTDLCDHIERSAELAAETQDFLSFATMLDLSLGDPRRFSVDEATLVLATLYKSLAAHTIILYKVGWDFPELLLRYIDRFFVGGVERLPEQKPFRLVMSLFSLLCENGNPRELLLRACELMMSTESELNSKRMQFMSLKDTEEQQEQIANAASIDSAQRGFDVWEDTRQENVKFCTLFEVIRFSLQKIESNVPSSFLLEATRTMLQVADDPNADLLSVTTYARRMFLLARDFTVTNEEQVGSEELQRVRNILVNFLTHATDVLLRKYTLKWSERLYVQMRNKVALAPPNERDFVYTETEYTSRMSEVVSRFAQLILAYDFDPHFELPKLFGIEYDDEGCLVGYQPTTATTKVDGAEVLADNYWSRQLLSGASALGTAELNTHLHFEGVRSKKPIWQNVAVCSLKMQENNSIRSEGVKDMLLYWALWASNYFGTDLNVDEGHDLLSKWLKMLLNLISLSPSPEERFVTGSIVARALRFLPPDFAYNFCVDNMKQSNSPAEQFVLVETLKMLITGKISNPEQQSKAAANTSKDAKAQLCTLDSCLNLSDERRTEITKVAGDAIVRLKKETQALPFYYLNFLMVVPTDPKIMLEICDNLDAISLGCEAMVVSEACLRQVDVLKNASAQLRDRAMNALQS